MKYAAIFDILSWQNEIKKKKKKKNIFFPQEVDKVRIVQWFANGKCVRLVVTATQKCWKYHFILIVVFYETIPAVIRRQTAYPIPDALNLFIHCTYEYMRCDAMCYMLRARNTTYTQRDICFESDFLFTSELSSFFFSCTDGRSSTNHLQTA